MSWDRLRLPPRQPHPAKPEGTEPGATRSPTPTRAVAEEDEGRRPDPPPESAKTASARMLPDGGGDDEERWLAEGIAGVQQNAFYMHRALDSNNLKDALKYSAQMLSELRTSRLSPHKYYELYMRAFDEMRKLDMFFREETRRGSCSVVDLYELVQHAGNVLPRL
ncbi:hypothetical protein ACQ4PT_003334 [Festuca glaucescens]